MVNHLDTRKVLNFDEMMNLYNKNDNFDIVDEEIYDIKTRSFNYRLDIFESFNQCGARNFRGTTFNLETKELLALPFYKFFNFNQSPFTLENIVKTWKIKNIYEKVDGSLIFFYKVNNKLVARTQRRCDNIQSIQAMKIVNQNEDIKKWIEDIIDKGYTPLFELLSPIIDPHVVHYKNIDTICLLGIRDKLSGYIYMADMDILPYYESNLISVFPIYDDKLVTLQDVIEDVKNETFNRDDLREGYVVLFENNELVKFKRPQYLSLSKLHDLTHTDTCVVEMLFNETLDDVVSEFKDDQVMLDYINNIVQSVDDIYNKRLKNSKLFYIQNKELDRKSYALKAKDESEDKESFGIIMDMYVNKGNVDEKKIQELFIRKKEWRKSKKFNLIEEVI